MIKSLIIFTLLLALAAGAFLSRPKPEEFKPFIKSKIAAKDAGLGGQILADMKTESYLKSCTINDRLLWVSVERDGKAVYTGAFNTWFGPSDPLAATSGTETAAKKK